MSAQYGPGIQRAYEGFFNGMDMVRNANRKEQDDQWAADVRERQKSTWQEEDELLKAKIENDKAELQERAELRPQAKEFRTKQLANQTKTAELEGAKLDAEQKHLPQTLQDIDIARAVQSAQTGQQALQSFMELGGQALSNGDLKGLTRVMGHMTRAKLIDAGGMGLPVDTQLVNIPKDEGALDFAGQPIAGQALKVTTDSGAEVYINPNLMRDAYTRAQAASDAANAKVIKPGEKWVTPSGQVLAEGAPRVSGGIVVDPETGEVIDMRPGGARAGGSGSGSGSGGSRKSGEPKPRAEQAQEIYETISQKGEFKHDPDTMATGLMMTTRAAAHDWLTPQEAAYVGNKVATLGDKALTPFFDPNTLQITGAYSEPGLHQGRPVPLAPGQMTLEEFASTPAGKAQGQKVVMQATDMFLRSRPAQNEQQREAARKIIEEAARNDQTYNQLMTRLEQSGDPQQRQYVQRLIEAHRVFGLSGKPAAQPAVPIASAQAGALPAAGAGLGGIPADAPAASLGGLGAAPAGDMQLQQQAAVLTPEVINGMGREDVRRVLNNAQLMRSLSNEQRNALQQRFSLAPN